jgi:hypothetical protein
MATAHVPMRAPSRRRDGAHVCRKASHAALRIANERGPTRSVGSVAG